MLTDNYQSTDLALVMQEHERILKAFETSFQMAQNANFELKGSTILELNEALENLEKLNRKKVGADAVAAAEQTRQLMF